MDYRDISNYMKWNLSTLSISYKDKIDYLCNLSIKIPEEMTELISIFIK